MTVFSDTEMWKLTDEQLTSAVVETFREKARIEARCAELASAAQDRELPRLAGCSSSGTWIANLTKVSVYEAARTVRRAEALGPDVEATRAAWGAGDLNGEQAEVIAKAVTDLPEWVDPSERDLAQSELLEAAERFNLHDLKRIANHILEIIDPDGVDEHLGRKLEEEEKKALRATSLKLIKSGDGMTRIRGLLPNVQAGILSAALEGIASPRRNSPQIYDRDGEHSDAAVGPLTHDQKMGRAFCELLEHLPSDAMPQHGDLASTITINIDFDALKDQIGKAVLSTGDEMSASQARRFACNAGLLPIVLDGKSQILDQGTAKRLYDKGQRVFLAHRDKGCVWKGCDRPPSWTEAHHIKMWSEGGPTDVSCGALFCFFHHHLLHDGEWWARMAPDGVPEVIPPKRIDPQQKPMRHSRFNNGP